MRPEVNERVAPFAAVPIRKNSTKESIGFASPSRPFGDFRRETARPGTHGTGDFPRSAVMPGAAAVLTAELGSVQTGPVPSDVLQARTSVSLRRLASARTPGVSP